MIEKIQLWHILVLTFVLLLPALLTGFFGDDLYHFAMLNNGSKITHAKDISLFNLFSFVDTNPARRLELQSVSIIPWWTSPNFKWSFWRPLTEITLYVDYAYLTNHIWLMHLHSIIWFFALIFLLSHFFQDVFASQKLALFATAIFALDGSHGMTVGWLCNRSVILTAFFSVLTLLIHHRSQKKPLLFPLAYLTFVLSLLSAEMGISTCAYLFAYALCLDQKKIIRSLCSLIPYFFIVVIWWMTYKTNGFGVAGSNDFYIEPLQNPSLFFQRLFENIPIIIASQWLPIPVDIVDKAPIIKTTFIGLGLLTLIILGWLCKQIEKPKLILYFVISGILSMFPLASTPLQDRNILFVSIAFAGLLTITLQFLWQKMYSSATSNHLPKILFGSLIFLHFIISPLLLMPMSYTPNFFQSGPLKRAATLADVKTSDDVVILGGPVMEIAYLAPSLFFLGKEQPKHLWNLCGNQQNFTAEIVDRNTMTLKTNSAFITEPEQFVRSITKEPFLAGDEISFNEMSIKIEQTNSKGQPMLLSVKFNRDIKELKIFSWDTTGFHRLNLEKGFPYEFVRIKT